MADQTIKKVKIKELPHTTSINDDDIFIESDSVETYKVTADDIAKYVSTNENLVNKYIEQIAIGATNGIAPLNSDKKIDGGYITYGVTSNTAYEGSAGKTLEENLDNHLLDEDAHGYATRLNDIYTKDEVDEIVTGISGGGGTTYTLSKDDNGDILLTDADGSTSSVTDSDTKNTAGATDTSDKIYLIGATSQTDNPQTFSHNTVYVGTDGCLYSNGEKVVTNDEYTNITYTDTEPTTQKVGDYWCMDYE